MGGDVLELPTDVFDSGNQRGTIIDSGTTLAYLPEEVYDPLLKAVSVFPPSFFGAGGGGNHHASRSTVSFHMFTLPLLTLLCNLTSDHCTAATVEVTYS